jgi:hypothetical protein
MLHASSPMKLEMAAEEVGHEGRCVTGRQVGAIGDCRERALVFLSAPFTCDPRPGG